MIFLLINSTWPCVSYAGWLFKDEAPVAKILPKEEPGCFKCLSEEEHKQMIAKIKSLKQGLDDRGSLLKESAVVLSQCDEQKRALIEKEQLNSELLATREAQLADANERIAKLDTSSTWETIWDWGWPVIALGLGAYIAGQELQNYRLKPLL